LGKSLMQLVKERLIKKLERINNYLYSKQHREPDFINLISELNTILDIVQNKKITIKIYSPKNELARIIKTSFEGYSSNLEQFLIVNPEKPVTEIVKYCEFICFVYESQQTISENDRLLMQAADRAKVDRAILVVNGDRDNSNKSITDWLTQQSYLSPDLLHLNKFFDYNNKEDLEQYYCSIESRFSIWSEQFAERIEQRIDYKIKKHFELTKKSIWQEIQQYKDLNTQGEPIDTYKHKISQIFQKINKQQQQKFRKIKQLVNQSKNDLINSFSIDSLSFEIQSVIQEAEIKILTTKKCTYLFLNSKDKKYIDKLPLYLAEILQKKLSGWLDREWQKIDRIYDEGGLNELTQKIARELAFLGALYPDSIELKSVARNNFQLYDFVTLSILEDNSRVTFDYNFTQSSWFRLLVAVGVGCLVYLGTKLIFGTGKYFGFVILFFQVINLLTGQDIKKIKLKQQGKELKRIADTKYQSLLKYLVDRISQDLIMLLDDESCYYQQQIDELAQTIEEKLLNIKNIIQHNKERIDRLDRDLKEILSLLD
jgi:hypothetical protein